MLFIAIDVRQHIADMNKAKDTIGRRLTAARKAADLSQREVAELLGIPPRTLSYYESLNGDLPSSLLVPLSDILGVETNELLGIDTVEKPGPKGYLQERLEVVQEMPRKDRQFVVKFLDQVIEDYDRRRRTSGKSTEK